MRSGISAQQLDDVHDKLTRVSNRELASMSILPLDVMMTVVAAEIERRVASGEPELTCKLIEVNEDQVHEHITPALINQLSELNKERVLLMVKGQSHYTTIDFTFSEKGNSFVILDAARHATSLPIYDILSQLKNDDDRTSNLFDSAIMVGDPKDRYDKVQTGYKGCSAFSANMGFESSKIPDFHQICKSARGNDPENQPAWSSMPPGLIRNAQSQKWWSQYRATHQAEAERVGPSPDADRKTVETRIIDWAADMAQQALKYLESKRAELTQADPKDVDRRMLDAIKSETNIASTKTKASADHANGASQHEIETITSSRDLIERFQGEGYVGDPSACQGLCMALSENGKLKELYEDFYKLDETLRHLDNQQISEILCTALLDHLPNLLNDSNNTSYCIGKAFPYLNSEQKTSVFEKIDFRKLINDITDNSDFVDVVSNIPPGKCVELCHEMLASPDKKGFFRSAKDFGGLLNGLEGEQCKAVVEGMKAADYKFPNNDSLEIVIQYLNDDKKSILENDLKVGSPFQLK